MRPEKGDEREVEKSFRADRDSQRVRYRIVRCVRPTRNDSVERATTTHGELDGGRESEELLSRTLFFPF